MLLLSKNISIHLMLMLINNTCGSIMDDFNFNTSHVNVNRLPVRQWRPYLIISIHLMLMLIVSILFSSITSSIISIHLMLMLIMERLCCRIRLTNFNTSHVNVNQLCPKIIGTIKIFQYISC